MKNIRSIYETEMKKKRKTKKRFVTNPIQKFRKSFRRFLCKIHFVIIWGICNVLVMTGCGSDVSILKPETMEDSSMKESADDNIIENPDTQKESKDENIETTYTNPLIYIDIGGAVARPGVYALKEGSRVFEVIALAGGFTDEAYMKNINQAKMLTDGEQIYVYTIQEVETLLEQGGQFGEDTWIKEQSVSVSDGSSGGKVNLNLADKETLMTLNGIGATRADAILQYRSEHGKFRSVEELMQVDGIKEGTYEKIKHCITVQ